MKKIDNLHISSIKSLISPAELKGMFPVPEECNLVTARARQEMADILTGKDQRLLAITGPCSIHDPRAALEYAGQLKKIQEQILEKVLIVMRVYFEKPRTTIGWKGLITDPHLDGSYDIEAGLKTARKLLITITSMGIPCGSEMLDPIIPQYTADLISWASIGARTTESQTHRELASGLSMPVGFKNSTSGDMLIAVNAMESARHSHSFIGIDQNGRTSLVKTTGNPFSHIILRGGSTGPNYYEENVELVEKLMLDREITPALIIDCSHANSGKQHQRQERVLNALLDQRKRGRHSIKGFMLESNLLPGAQEIPANPADLVYGQSITDACIGWDETAELLVFTAANAV